MWELSSLSNFIQNINFIELHPCDNFRTQWIWLHQHHEFDFIHQTHFHFMFHLCSISCIWSISWIPWIWRVWCVLFGEFYPIRHFHLFHGIHPNLLWWNGPISSKCTKFHLHGSNLLDNCHNLRFGHMDQFPFIHVCSILSNFLSSMWCSFEIK